MVSNYKENSPLRWFISGCIASVIIVLFLLLMVRESRKPPLSLGPVMELDYVVVENNVVKVEKKITKVQTKKVQQEQVPEKPPVETIDAPEIINEPVQFAEIPQSEPTPVTEKRGTTDGNKTSAAIKRIGTIAELDNTEFEPLFNPKPDYPVVAQASHITGYVDVDLVINEQGKVESFTIVETRGHPSFAVETAKVLPRWRFPPPRVGGRKVRVQYTYRVNFTLH